MKKTFISFLFCCLLLNLTSLALSQYYWHQPTNLTRGNIDKNPSFGTYNIPGVTGFNILSWEYFVFERTTLTTTQICAMKMGPTGPLESEIYITANASSKRNPVISYGKASGSFYGDMNSALILWESNQNGKWDIFGKYYSRQSGWGSVFAVDESAGDKSQPHVCYLDSVTYAVTYVKSGDVIFRKINAMTHAVLVDSNLTSADTAICRNANIMASDPSKFLVTYEKRKPDGKYAIWYRKSISTSTPVWFAPDTIAYAGNNTFSRFCFGNYGLYLGVAFESDRGGTYNIYSTSVPMSSSGTNIQDKLSTFSSSAYNFSNFVSIFYPIITDNIMSNTLAFQRKGRDSLKIMFDDGPISSGNSRDSTTIGDTSKRTCITMNASIYNTSWTETAWVVYIKDSANTTQLWARYRLVTLADIKKTGTEVPDGFALYQNYPNPFNPVTKIKFDIPGNLKLYSGNGIVSLKVCDLLGREVAVLANGKFLPGVYEAVFDGNSMPSGVYFCRLSVNNEQVAVMKMVMAK
ncbi:MAG: T9SS type A sorting domain-containing protein [Bacteroidetes bacterium]|nr:T9SS type A sorting domain-containing protein [Bacteroidota bacterium]